MFYKLLQSVAVVNSLFSLLDPRSNRYRDHHTKFFCIARNLLANARCSYSKNDHRSTRSHKQSCTWIAGF